jgi:hypothetical protein
MYEYIDHLGRCERMGEIIPEAELTSVIADNGVELLLCSNCVEELGIGILAGK